MAKGSKTNSSESRKISFGKKRTGKPHKSYNKNDKSERNYRGQGR